MATQLLVQSLGVGHSPSGPLPAAAPKPRHQKAVRLGSQAPRGVSAYLPTTWPLNLQTVMP